MLDAPLEVLAAALNYLGKNPNSTDPKDYEEAGKLMMKVRPYITYFHSSQYINDLANGDICLVLGWSGDILQAKSRAEEAGDDVHVAYSLPKEGAAMWFDMLAIPADAKHPENAHAFINYLLQPEVIAEISDYVAYANPNQASFDMVDEAVRNDPNIYPSPDVKAKLYTFKIMPPDIERLTTRLWTRIKTGH